jgi:integrase/recombinase XerD
MPAPPTLDELIETSLRLQDRTKELYRDCVAEFVAFAGGDPSTYSSAVVERWLFSLLKDRKPQTVNVYRKAIRYASRRWKKQDSEHVDFAADVDKVKAQPAEPRVPLTYDEAAKLLATCDGDELVAVRDRALIILALRSGLRRGGLRALEFSGIKPPKITTTNKGGAPITFEADAETLGALEEWRKRLVALGVTSGPVFRAVRGKKIRGTMSAFQIWRVFDTRAKQAEIRHVFPHLARHSTVTWLREEGKSSAEVGKLTGQTERTIENIYTHVRTRGAIGNALPSLFGKKPSSKKQNR